MSQQDFLTLAKQGDPKAIAFLINQALASKGVTAKATCQDHCLHLLLEADQLPTEDACLRVVVRGLVRLQVPSLWSMTVYGRQRGQRLPGWTQTVEFKKPSPFQAVATPAPPRPVQTPAPAKPPQKTVVPPQNLPQQSVPPQPAYVTVTPPRPPAQPLNAVPSVAVASTSYASELAGASTSQNPWLLVTAVGVVALPLSGFVLSSQLFPPLKIASEPLQPTSQIEILPPSPSPSRQPPRPAEPNPVATVQSSPIPAITTPVVEPKPAFGPDTRISIKAVGDIIPGTNFPYNKLPKNKEQLFDSVKPYLQGADLLFGNFESTLTNYPYSAKGAGGGMLFAFRTPPTYAQLLKDVGFNVLSVANNHSYDFHEQGFKDTMNNIDRLGMKSVGRKNQVVYKTVKGVRVAFIGFSNYGDVHNSLLELKAGEELVKSAKKNAEIVVISVHAGAEGTGALHVRNKTEYFYGENRGNKVLFAHRMIDAGADLILGHGPHVPRALELYKGKLIAYSLGNFMGYRSLSTVAELGQSLILEVTMNPQGNFETGKIIPVQLDDKGIPYIDQSFTSVGLIRSLTKSDFPNTPLTINNKGEILKK